MAGRFEPKEPVTLNPPKDDPITLDDLSKANGMTPISGYERKRSALTSSSGIDGAKCYVAIKVREISWRLGQFYES